MKTFWFRNKLRLCLRIQLSAPWCAGVNDGGASDSEKGQESTSGLQTVDTESWPEKNVGSSGLKPAQTGFEKRTRAQKLEKQIASNLMLTHHEHSREPRRLAWNART